MASRKPLVNVSGTLQEMPVGDSIDSLVLPVLGAAPGSPVQGQEYFDTAANASSIYDGAGWTDRALDTDKILWGGNKVRASLPRNSHLATVTPVTATQYLYAVVLRKGDVITNLAFINSGAAVAPTQWWFALYNGSGTVLGQTAAQGSAAWGASTAKSLAISGGAYTVTATGIHYICFYMVAGTPVTLLGASRSDPTSMGLWDALVSNSAVMARSKALASTATAPTLVLSSTSSANAVALCAGI